ncbi:hypothetical protein ACFWIA_29885 [Streptomyces sp. NPDC127068]|uniref:hypothetical protein n=1 Tax=Streptomyces sp. NPDC127068 TaxID=3347127 RepID=UPI003655F8B6
MHALALLAAAGTLTVAVPSSASAAWSGPNCTGLLVGWVGPGGHDTFEADTVRIG